MKRGNGIKDRKDRSRGTDILMTDTFTEINPTDPLRLTKEVVRRIEIDPIPPWYFIGESRYSVVSIYSRHFVVVAGETKEVY
jgi:hypothetical protein